MNLKNEGALSYRNVALTSQKTVESHVTYGISCGKTSASILMDSVLGLAVGAAARRIFNMAI